MKNYIEGNINADLINILCRGFWLQLILLISINLHRHAFCLIWNYYCYLKSFFSLWLILSILAVVYSHTYCLLWLQFYSMFFYPNDKIVTVSENVFFLKNSEVLLLRKHLEIAVIAGAKKWKNKVYFSWNF